MHCSGKTITRMKPTTILAPVLAVMLILSACGKPMDAQALVAEAKQYQQQGDNKAAIIQLKNALKQSPMILKFVICWVRSMIKVGMYYLLKRS